MASVARILDRMWGDSAEEGEPEQMTDIELFMEKKCEEEMARLLEETGENGEAD